jgi:tRNA (mo5U34)-methyltransferase
MSALRAEIEGTEWYHTFELAPDIVTPGWFDLRGVVDRIPFPGSLAGKRCLDVGTFDGFWAFEMERRGGEVLAIDLLDPWRWDWPAGSKVETVMALDQRKRAGRGFEVARRAFESNVERRELSIYDLDPGEIGHFDVVYVGSLLLHLRDPVAGLGRVRDVCSGTAIICDAIDVAKSLLYRKEPVAGLDARGRPWWWRPNVAALERMIEAAGLRLTAPTRRIRMPAGAGRPKPPIRPRLLRSRAGRQEILETRLGDPHAIAIAEPA